MPMSWGTFHPASVHARNMLESLSTAFLMGMRTISPSTAESMTSTSEDRIRGISGDRASYWEHLPGDDVMHVEHPLHLLILDVTRKSGPASGSSARTYLPCMPGNAANSKGNYPKAR